MLSPFREFSPLADCPELLVVAINIGMLNLIYSMSLTNSEALHKMCPEIYGNLIVPQAFFVIESMKAMNSIALLVVSFLVYNTTVVQFTDIWKAGS